MSVIDHGSFKAHNNRGGESFDANPSFWLRLHTKVPPYKKAAAG